MTTLIIQNVTATPLKFKNAYSLNPVYISGVASELTIHFHNSFNSIITGEQKLLVLQGEYKHDRKHNSYSLFNAQLVDLPNEDTWLSFLLEYFMQYIPLITFDTWKSKSPEFTNFHSVSISAFTKYHYIDCTISIDSLTIRKIEFGRYMVEKGENLTSWTKGVFVNKAPYYIEFIQTSFDGEDGKKYRLDYTQQNKGKLLKFLDIPFNKGWTEMDYYFKHEEFYKASVSVEGINHKWSFNLLEMIEQDIPMLFDKPIHILVSLIADIVNFRKVNYCKTIVPPINENSNIDKRNFSMLR